MLLACKNLWEAARFFVFPIYKSFLSIIFFFLEDLLPENYKLIELFRAVPVETDTFSPWIGNKLYFLSKSSINLIAEKND